MSNPRQHVATTEAPDWCAECIHGMCSFIEVDQGPRAPMAAGGFSRSPGRDSCIRVIFRPGQAQKKWRPEWPFGSNVSRQEQTGDRKSCFCYLQSDPGSCWRGCYGHDTSGSRRVRTHARLFRFRASRLKRMTSGSRRSARNHCDATSAHPALGVNPIPCASRLENRRQWCVPYAPSAGE